MRTRWVGLATSLMLATSLLTAAPPGASGVAVVGRAAGGAADSMLRTDDYPTWGQVEAAKKNAATAAAELKNIRALVVQLQQAANAAFADQLAKQAAYAIASAKLATATANANALAARAKSAKADADRTRAQFGRLAAQMYVSGGDNMTARLLLSTGSNSDLLDRLGSMSQLTGQISSLQSRARTEQNLAQSFSAQAASAENARAKLAADAKSKLTAATAAKQHADDLLAQQQAANVTLTAQAASLAGTSAAIEKKYQEGIDLQNQAANSGGGSNVNIDNAGIVVDPAAAQTYAQSRMSAYGWGGGTQFQCLIDLWTMESGWRADAYNTSSGAYGIPQALPANKMSSAGADWQTNANTQIDWGLVYISGRYGTPCGAWNAEMSRNPHWY